MKKEVILWLLVTVMVSSAIFVGLARGQQVPSAAPEPTGTLVVAQIELCDVFDPIRVNSNQKTYLSIVFENLVGQDHNGKIDADFGLAEKWEMSPDAKTWTFYVRKGIKFHNGDEVTAEDVKFSVERVMSPNSVMTFSGMFRETIERVEFVNRYTLRIHCKKPIPELYRMFSPDSYEGFVMPQKYIKEKGDVYFGLHPVGTGPYKVVEMVGGYQVKLEAAFKSHWLYGPAKYKNLVFRLVPEELTRIGLIKTGEADIARISEDRVAGVKAAGFNVIEDPGAAVSFLAIPEQWRKEYPVHDKRVRQALALAINREEIFKHIFHGIGRLSGSMVTIKSAVGYRDLPIYEYNPQKAKQLLKEAGYPDGFKIKIHSFPTEMFPSLPRTMEAVAGYFEQIGVKTEIIPYADWQAVRQKVIAKEMEGGIFACDTGGRSTPLNSMHLYFHSASRFHEVEIPELDEWINKARSTLDEAERVELIKKIDKYINDNYCFLMAVERSVPYVISNKLKPWDMGSQTFDINLPQVLMHKARH